MNYYARQFGQPRMTKAVKFLLIAIAVIFVLQLTLRQFLGFIPEIILGFAPERFLTGWIWQIFTYPFLHGGLTHILFNCLILYMIGTELELRWGTRKFVKFYAVCAVGGAMLQTLIFALAYPFSRVWADELGSVPIIGASGALYGLFMAFGKLYGNAQILVFFMFPMKAKHFVMMLAGIEIVSAVFYSNSGVAHLVHLGGLGTGYLYLRLKGDNLSGGGGGWRRRRRMDRDEVRQRLNLIVNNDPNSDEQRRKDGKYPITWN